jgi:hypothetical protein
MARVNVAVSPGYDRSVHTPEAESHLHAVLVIRIAADFDVFAIYAAPEKYGVARPAIY